MKEVIIHGLLAVFGLGLAFQTWARKPEEEAKPGSVVVAECSAEQVQKLSLENPTNEFQVEPKRDRGEPSYWIATQPKRDAKAEAEKKKDDKPADPHAAPAADAAADKDKKDDKEVPEGQRPKRFLANNAFNDYLKRFTPLRAQRSLGQLPKDKDADFGFDKVGTYVKLQCGGRTTEFEVGARAFGASQRYVRDKKTQTTYLFDEALISDLESASFKFMQADLHNFDKAEVEQVTVDARGAKKTLLHRDRKLSEQALWVDAAAQGKRNDLFNNWMNRLGRLRARVYLPEGAEPGSELKGASSGGTDAVLTVEYKVEGKPNGKLELVRVDENGVGHYYGRTETTRGWVALYDSMAKDVEQDVGMVVGVEAERPKAEAAPSAPPTDAHGHGALPPGHPTVPSTPQK